MRKIIFLSATAIALASLVFVYQRHTVTQTEHFANSETYPKAPGKMPNDWFFVQRSWPYDTLSNVKRLSSITYAKEARRKSAAGRQQSAAPIWQQAGPTNIPGRIVDLAVDASNIATVYAASAAGGVFKSVDSGKTWAPVFNDNASLSIGAIAMDPSNADVLYAGTGESNPSFDSFNGTGIYKTTDGGVTWNFSGLPNSFRIGRIIVDPSNSQRVFAAVNGKHFGGGNTDRGVYRSLDGGASWSQMLFVSDSTGCIDLAHDPATGTLIAAMWERIRFVDEPTRLGGITSGLYRSTDNGDTWTELNAANGLPDPADSLGRIGVTMCPAGNTVYANYSTDRGAFMGMYRSLDLGATWSRTLDFDLVNAPLNASWNGGWYFGQVRVAPSDAGVVYALGFQIWRSSDGGDSWFNNSAGIHVDQHAMWIHPTNPDILYSGCDGGVNFSTDGGLSWTRRFNQPSTQFYAITIDPTNPERLYGGTQDNGTMRTLTGAVNDWNRILGGDGFYVIVDPTDPDVIYAESQFGWLAKSINGGASWSNARGGMNYNGERHGWSTPIAMDPSDNQVLYYGSNKLNKTIDGAQNWFLISGDLTNAPHPRSSFGTISTIDVSATDGDVIYVGTDDGNVWVTQDGGALWTQIDGALPKRWITRVAVDPRHSSIVYVTVSGYHSGESLPHIFRSEDFGATWTAINGDLPDAAINDVIPLAHDSLRLYIATDFGVYETNNLGSNWSPLGNGLPILSIFDLAFHPPSGKLVAGTHGQSMFSTTVPATPGGCCQTAGDANSSGTVNIADVTFLIARIFAGGAAPSCCSAASSNGDSSVNIADVTFLIARIFAGGPPPICGPAGIGC